MTISVATQEQLPVIRDLAFKIWPQTYGTILSNDQFDYMMEMMYSIESLEKQIETKPFLLVEDERKYIGFASYELHFKDENQKKEPNLKQVHIKTKIHKLYVLSEMQGKGIGKSLVNYIKTIAVQAQNTSLILTVNRFNKAKDFYLKQGFSITEEKQFQIGNGYIMDDYVMECFF